jgi:hypothetical protein
MRTYCRTPFEASSLIKKLNAFPVMAIPYESGGFSHGLSSSKMAASLVLSACYCILIYSDCLT